MTFLRSHVANRILMAALLAAGALGAGCNSSEGNRDGGGGSGGGGGGSGTSTACPGTLNGSCRYTGGADCFDFTGLPDSAAVAMAELRCSEDGMGTWADTACTHTGALGACSQMQGGAACVAQWAYTGTLADAMADCADNQGTWINP